MEVYILYGSQTGNSEDIAKDIFSKCQESGILSTCSTLNDVKKIVLKERAKCIVIVCSTTGNGDAPENADGWWRQTKLRSAAKDLYENVPFAVLGLGDTNYDKFCHMGKSIDKRLAELGGKRILDLHCADEATGLEETVEEWKIKIMDVLTSLDATETHATAAGGTESGSVESKSQEVGAVKSYYPVGLLSICEVAAKCGLSDTISVAVHDSQLPRSTKWDSCHSIIKVIEDTSMSTESLLVEDWSAERPYLAAIKRARWLTDTSMIEERHEHDWGHTKRVVELEVSLGKSGIRYSPGDSVGVLCPNPRDLVEIVLARLRNAHPDQTLTLSSCLDGLVLPGSNLPYKQPLSLEEVLFYRVDLTSVPRKQSVFNLAQHCKSEQEATLMRWLCSKGAAGKTLWGQFIEAQRVGLGELMVLFPSCCPPLPALLSVCSGLVPRFYSIACSPMLYPNSIKVAFSVVRYYCSLNPLVANVHGGESKPHPRIARSGIATAYLESVLTRWLHPSPTAQQLPGEDLATTTIRIFHKPTICFRLPGSVAVPLILIGPGTGISPFIGFLQHRVELERERNTDTADECVGVWRGNFELGVEDLPAEGKSCAVESYINSLQPGPIYLFGGCRDQSDYLYKEELEERQACGTLTVLDMAMSRVGPEKVYVTHRLQARGAEITKLLLQDGAAVYICGDGNNMAKDVYASFKGMLQSHGSLSEDEAEQFLQSMKQRKRFVLDIWS